MARVNITVPDELLTRARKADLNVSRLAASALAEELDRRAKITALDDYLSELEAEFGPTSNGDRAAAQQWADRLLDTPTGEPSTPADQPSTTPARQQSPLNGSGTP